MDYYEKIKNELVENEITKRAKEYSKNKSDLTHYYNVGKLLIDAGKHYGEGIIKKYSRQLTIDLGKGYTETNLKYYRQFYLFSKSHTMCDELTWSHYRILLSISDNSKVDYYIYVTRLRRLTVRQLQTVIKSNEYERIEDKSKNKIINNQEINITDFIKNPLIIKNNLNIEEITEKYLKRIILDDIEGFIKELGDGYSFIGSEYKIKIGDNYNYIDLLLFNYKYNCFVVIELKITELKKEHIGGIEVYMNYIDKHVKEIN